MAIGDRTWAFLIGAVCGFLAALAGSVALVFTGSFHDWGFYALVFAPGKVVALALVLALSVGGAAATAGTQEGAARRGCGAALVLGVGVLVTLALVGGPDFGAEPFFGTD